jgi:hypothetical protein
MRQQRRASDESLFHLHGEETGCKSRIHAQSPNLAGAGCCFASGASRRAGDFTPAEAMAKAKSCNTVGKG